MAWLARKGSDRHGSAGLGSAWQSWLGWAGRGLARLAWQARRGTVWIGGAWPGLAGMTWLGGARQGLARQAWQGLARRGLARLGAVGREMAMRDEGAQARYEKILVQQLAELHLDRLVAGYSIAAPMPRLRRDWPLVIDRVVAFATGAMLGVLGVLWVIWGIR